MQPFVDSPAIELTEDLFIGKGTSRKCYRHPMDSNKCVKVAINSGGEHHNQNELKAYAVLKAPLRNYIVLYDEILIATDQGSGLVCELLRDDDGNISESLTDHKKKSGITDDLKRQIDDFFFLLLSHRFNFYDFNLKNFIVQKKEGDERLVYIDIKSYNRSKTLFKLENLFPPAGRHKMKRRMCRLYELIDA